MHVSCKPALCRVLGASLVSFPSWTSGVRIPSPAPRHYLPGRDSSGLSGPPPRASDSSSNSPCRPPSCHSVPAAPGLDRNLWKLWRKRGMVDEVLDEAVLAFESQRCHALPACQKHNEGPILRRMGICPNRSPVTSRGYQQRGLPDGTSRHVAYVRCWMCSHMDVTSRHVAHVCCRMCSHLGIVVALLPLLDVGPKEKGEGRPPSRVVAAQLGPDSPHGR